MERALRLRAPGPYQLQAAIAALHDGAATPDATDWPQIAALYGELERRSPSPVVALNHAVAIAMAEGIEIGLARIDRIAANGILDDYPYLHAARADLLRRLGRFDDARAAYERALGLTANAAERRFLRRRLVEVGSERRDRDGAVIPCAPARPDRAARPPESIALRPLIALGHHFGVI